jgi:hypothetical protein
MIGSEALTDVGRIFLALFFDLRPPWSALAFVSEGEGGPAIFRVAVMFDNSAKKSATATLKWRIAREGQRKWQPIMPRRLSPPRAKLVDRSAS